MSKPTDVPALFDWWGLMLSKARKHEDEPCPLLEAVLPILEYTPEQLKRGSFFDKWLVASIKAQSLLSKAGHELRPLGIYEEDLFLLLHERMREQLRRQREKKRRTRRKR